MAFLRPQILRLAGTRATHMGCDGAVLRVKEEDFEAGTRATHMGCDQDGINTMLSDFERALAPPTWGAT